MGGSILGAEAIHNFLQQKIKKVYFFDLNENKISLLKKRKIYQIFFSLLYLNQEIL